MGISFTTNVIVNNFDIGAVQVIWSGADTAVGTIKLQGSCDATNFSDLQWVASAGTLTSTYTLTTANSSQLWDVSNYGFNVLRVVYAAVSNTTGSLDVWTTRKSRK